MERTKGWWMPNGSCEGIVAEEKGATGNNYTLIAPIVHGEGNLEYICRAVNCHEAMLATAKELLAWYERFQERQCYIDDIKKLIAEAEGG